MIGKIKVLERMKIKIGKNNLGFVLRIQTEEWSGTRGGTYWAIEKDGEISFADRDNRLFEQDYSRAFYELVHDHLRLTS